ncbi:unnamed protein product, partial [Mesorhabditis belari]
MQRHTKTKGELKSAIEFVVREGFPSENIDFSGEITANFSPFLTVYRSNTPYRSATQEYELLKSLLVEKFSLKVCHQEVDLSPRFYKYSIDGTNNERFKFITFTQKQETRMKIFRLNFLKFSEENHFAIYFEFYYQKPKRSQGILETIHRFLPLMNSSCDCYYM